MAGRVELVTLVLVFLAALLVHYLMTAKESFANPVPTQLTKEALKTELDNIVTEMYADYLTLNKEKTKTDAIKLRLVFYTGVLNFFNDLYKRFAELSLPPNLTLDDVRLVKQFILYTLSPVYISSIQTPATDADLRLFSSRLQAISARIQARLPLLFNVTDTAIWIDQLNSHQKIILSNVNGLMAKILRMKPSDVPLFKTDRYLFVAGFARLNFVIDPSILDQPMTPNIDALPMSNTVTTGVATILQPSTVLPTPTTTPQPLPSGLKFSELIKSLMSYDGIVAVQAQAQATKAQAKSAESNPLAEKASEPQPTTTDMDSLKTFVSDEVASQLAKYKLGPKDVQNAAVADRKTAPVKTETPEASSDALEQGKWFRNENSAACPYATGQQATGSPQPYPIDMNDYVRKDSIPCWGCNLK